MRIFSNIPDLISSFDASPVGAAVVWNISVRLELFAMEFVSAFNIAELLEIFAISFKSGIAEEVEHETVS